LAAIEITMKKSTATGNFQVIRYQKSDLDSIERFFRSVFAPEYVPVRKTMFDWITSHNPVADTESYLVVKDNKEVIAHMGRMPVEIMINNSKRKGYFFHDLLVHPECRKKGLGISLTNYLHSSWENKTGTFSICIWTNEFTNSYYRRRHYYQLNAYSFVKPIKLSSVLSRKVKNKLILGIIAMLGTCLVNIYELFTLMHRHPNLSILRIDRFDERFDKFAEEVAGKFGVIVLRSSRYLNWKYIGKPLADYTVYTAERENKLTGYIVLRTRNNGCARQGIIVDILADPDDKYTIAFLCQAAIDHFKKERVDFINCFLTNKRFIKVFRQYLFIQNRETKPVMIANLHKFDAQELITDIDSWFLTFGDSDAEMWD
jgi:predicted N-acetyltransferase YhbS